ncbi:hypothetical protein OKW12_000136 [Pseudomonas silensiensis]|nr:hypothetical protein [Pseudomonas silensiensis]
MKIKTQFGDVGVELREVAAQLSEPLHFMQRIGEVHVFGVQLAEALQTVFIQLRELPGKLPQEITHERLRHRVARASS